MNRRPERRAPGGPARPGQGRPQRRADRPAGAAARGRSAAPGGPGEALIDLLRALLSFDQPADRQMQAFFRSRPAVGRRDRARLADHAYAVLRARRLYAHLAEGGPGPHERRMALLAQADGAFPPLLAVDPAEQAWLDRVMRIDRATLPWAVRASLPDWLADRLLEQLPADEAERLGEVLLSPAGLDLRVNLLRAQPAEVRAALEHAGIGIDDVRAPRLAALDTLIRVHGRPNLAALPIFERGAFEVQDAGSQIVASLCGVRRGQTVVDFCAGAGGKTLALAAAMRNSGQIYACDVSARRLQSMRERLARSGATNVQPLCIEGERDPRLARLRGKADRVLVDAPCAGTGTLRRNPDLKWRYGVADIERLSLRQQEILAAAAELVAPGGWLVYATCSLLREENEAVAEAFEARTEGFGRLEPGAADATSSAGTTRAFLRLWPHRDDCDGFFAAAWQRSR